MNLPMETVMKLPIQDRRYFIRKHNEEQAGIKAEREKNSNQYTVEGEAINEFAKNEQENIKNRKRGA